MVTGVTEKCIMVFVDMCVCTEWQWALIRWHSISWEENIPSCSRFPSMTPRSGYDSKTAAWPCVHECVRMYLWVGMWVSKCAKTCSNCTGAHMHMWLCALRVPWVCHILKTDITNIVTSSAQRKKKKEIDTERHFHILELNWDTDLRSDSTGPTGSSRWLEREVFHKSGMC